MASNIWDITLSPMLIPFRTGIGLFRSLKGRYMVGIIVVCHWGEDLSCLIPL